MTLDPAEVLAIATAVAERVQRPAVVAALPKFLTYDEFGEQLRCSGRTVRDMADKGKIRRVYPTGESGMPRIPRSELDRIERRGLIKC